jgi:hypothetical protein
MELVETISPAPIGHNEPPESIEERASALTVVGARWFDDPSRQEINDEDTAGKLKDFLDQIDAFIKKSDAERLSLTAPLRDATSSINERYKLVKGGCELLKKKLRPRLAAYLDRMQAEVDAEKARVSALAAKLVEEAAEAAKGATTFADLQAAELAEEAAKQAKKEAQAAPDRAQVSGSLGGRAASTRVHYSAQIVDYEAALAHYAGDSRLKEALQTIVNEASRNMRGQGSIPGVKLITEQR